MKEQEVVFLVRNKGKVGCTHTERYIDISDKQIREGDKWICQIVSFEDERGLAVYWLNEFDEGEFMEYSQMKEETRTRVENILNNL